MKRAEGGPGGEARETHDAAMRKVRAVLDERRVGHWPGRPVGSTLYGTPLQADLLLGEAWDPRTAVFVRAQESVGSGEHKLPYLVLSIARGTLPAVLVIDGGGWSAGALRWVMGQRNERLLRVVDVDGLDEWCATQGPTGSERSAT